MLHNYVTQCFQYSGYYCDSTVLGYNDAVLLYHFHLHHHHY